MKRILSAIVQVVAALLCLQPLTAQENHRPLQYDIALGAQSYHLPGLGADWQPSATVIYAGATRPLNDRQTLALTLRLGYARGRYQGDALDAQLLLNLTPVVARHIEVGLSLGAGYRWCFHPSQPLAYGEGGWTSAGRGKGVFQAPVQLSLGYRSLRAGGYEWRPYLGYQAQVLFGYSPDLGPLPVTTPLIGIKVSPQNTSR